MIKLDLPKLMAAVEACKLKRNISWEQVTLETGLGSNSHIHNLRSYARRGNVRAIGVHNAFALMHWMGRYDIREFSREET